MFDSAPFSHFTPTDYRPAIEKAIAESLVEIAHIAQNPDSATFENTVAALAYVG